jgi:carbamoyl-phosphate synthase large subunit
MNVLITSPGRRVELVRYFKETLNRNKRKLFTLDMSSWAPALYFSDKWFLIKKDFNNINQYIDDIIEICNNNDITTVLTLIDPELQLFREFEERFNENGIDLFMPEKEFNFITYDKLKFYDRYRSELPLLDTYASKEELIDKKKNLTFPILAKDRFGSGSSGVTIIKSVKELEAFEYSGNLIFQTKLENFKEFSIHVYFDAVTNDIVDVFMSQAIVMRGGEADKMISLWDENIYKIIKRLSNIQGIKGTINVDIFTVNDEVYINEINPRFGGGYNHAHYCGRNFVEYTVNNIMGFKNSKVTKFPAYETDIEMMKYYGFFFKKKTELFNV